MRRSMLGLQAWQRVPALALVAALCVSFPLAVGLSGHSVSAQDKGEAEKPAGAGEAPKPAETDLPQKKEPAEKKAPAPEPEPEPTPAFDTREALLKWFDDRRGALQTAFEQAQPAGKEAAEKALEKLRSAIRDLDTKQVVACEHYIRDHAEADDIGLVRYDRMDLLARLGRWQEAWDASLDFCARHSGLNKDLLRQASFIGADALSQIEGKEVEAASALERVIASWPESLEAQFARVGLGRMYLLLAKIAEAKRLWLAVQNRPEVQESEAEAAMVKERLLRLDQIGTVFPATKWTSAPSGDELGDQLAKLPTSKTVLWYYQSTSQPCLEELPALNALSKALPAGVTLRAVSLDKDSGVWRQFVRQESAGVPHVYEGFEGDELPWRVMKLRVVPVIVLVNDDGKLHRVDVPMSDLARTLRKWTASAVPNDQQGNAADKPAASE